MRIPDVNQPVLLRGHEGEYASRVEGLDDSALTLARPFGLPLDTTLDEGRPFDVEWTSAAGMHALPVRVTERSVDGKVRIWHAVPTGPARLLNRRAHVRVAVAIPVTIELEDEQVTASLLDVSEAAVRCLVREPLPPQSPDSLVGDGGRPVRVRFTLAGQEFALKGSILRSTPSQGGSELIVILPEDERTATAVRRAVFAEQIRARQLSRE
ncbi:MAG: PilZ domain-containing protein [Nocardioides sp.]|uniref:PilZ domain-containing protein n=1 Tax=Nocardioides nematodiphilus TaxID=2849669 RepID=UPI001CDA2C97|nr:PilZ domain-containing protein [Nocardioides nematodiphilus]MCA1984784.1 PilZ domain-containing protein [Nocardioides nematodiphilus]